MYKVQVDYTYNIEDGSSVTSSVYYLINADDEQGAMTSMQSYINENTTQRTMIHNNIKYLVPTNTGVAVNAIIE